MSENVDPNTGSKPGASTDKDGATTAQTPTEAPKPAGKKRWNPFAALDLDLVSVLLMAK